MTDIKAGHTVRIRESYRDQMGGEVEGNTPGTEFVVTRVVRRDWDDTTLPEYYVTGDPADWGIWIDQVERVEEISE